MFKKIACAGRDFTSTLPVKIIVEIALRVAQHTHIKQ